MRIEYGPPGHRGVTQIMGLGETTVLPELPPGSRPANLLPRQRSLQHTGGLALAVTAVGMLVGSSTVRNVGLGGMAAVIVAQLLADQNAAKGIPEEASLSFPDELQGY